MIRLRAMTMHRIRLLSLLAALALAGCTEKLVGYRAEFASNTVAVSAHGPSGDRLSFRVPKQTTDLSKRPVYLAARGCVLHLRGFLPLTPDGVDDAGEHWEVRITVPRDVEKGTAVGTRAYGDLYIPAEVGTRSFTGVELREPSGTRVLGATLTPVYSGPMTSLADSIGSFLRGLYAAR